MADHLTPERRSANMRKIKGGDTRPEMVVRRAAHSLGYRFRLHRRDLPGTPDLVFPRYRSVILVHGCFWHQHTCKRGARVPNSNVDYWSAKIARNAARDAASLAELERRGWRTLVIWECESKDQVEVEGRIRRFLGVIQ